MQVFTLIFSTVCWCITMSRAQTAITSYLPNTYSSMSEHSITPPSGSSSGGPTAYAVSGYSLPAKYYGSLQTTYTRPKIFTVLSHKYTMPTSIFDISNIKHYEEGFHHVPAHYEFQYKVHDHHHGSEFGHAESRIGDVAKGRYMVLLPDGRRQIVDYIADRHGYRPTIRYESGNEKIGYRR